MIPRHQRMTQADKARKVRKQRERRIALGVPRSWYLIGVTREQYERMYKAQQGRCAICGKKKPPHRQGQPRNSPFLHVDHCHKSGKVRGLLCYSCNSKLGFVEKYLGPIVKYLRKYG